MAPGSPPRLPPTHWDVFIGHYLGVDHAGHAGGVAGNPAMAAKLAQLDGQVAAIAGAGAHQAFQHCSSS
jgi:hypothetical protein